MLIDWVTARIPLENLTDEGRDKALLLGDRIQRFCPRTGQVKYESMAWDSIRSDSHQVNVKASGSGVTIMGSPARVCGDGCAVFGSGASSMLSIGGCVDAMRLFVQQHTGIELPADLSLWQVTRIDITGNLRLASHAEVLDALRILRDCEGGRYRVSQQAGDTVYWSHKSTLRSAKAYAKGAHLAYLNKLKTYTGRPYTLEEIDAANHLLRLELKLGHEFFRRENWRHLTPANLKAQWQNYFSRMIGDATMTNDNDLKARVMAVAKTEGQGKAAYGCWLMIHSQGWERARDSFSKPSWYRHLKYLRAAGLGDADISAGQVVQLRRRVFDAQLVTSWQQLKAA